MKNLEMYTCVVQIRSGCVKEYRFKSINDTLNHLVKVPARKLVEYI